MNSVIIKLLKNVATWRDLLLKKFEEYITEISKVKDELEHSGRTFLQNLLKEFCDIKHIDIVHESKRDKNGLGAPDFKFIFNNTTIGYLENKKVDENLDDVLKSPQISKYKLLSDNLIITDYLRWIWIYNNEIIKDVRLCNMERLEFASISLNDSNVQEVVNLIQDFLSCKPMLITKSKDLAQALAKPTKEIKIEVAKAINKDENDNARGHKLTALFNIFKKNISEHITEEDFADAFAQTLTYSLFLTKLNLINQNTILTLSNISDYTPNSFALIKDILDFIKELNKFPTLKPYVERIVHIVNSVNSFEISQDLAFSKNQGKDPYIYFYEDFLHAYDPKIKEMAGVYYTPKVVVDCIVNNIDDILKNEFNLSEGLAEQKIKILDFACGTGTFLFSVYEKILASVPFNSLKKDSLIRNHILKNIFGFELLIPAYCVSHLTLSQYLKESANYNLQANERIGVYLTNTLENNATPVVDDMFNLVPHLALEGKIAQKIKEDDDILVIIGNPPYNGNSQNNFENAKQLVNPYYPNDDIKERNTKWLQDDYVKFIAFAEDKIKKAKKGVVGIITNHGFIDNPTFRAMRKHLMQTFNSIYVIDLHGNTKKKETSPDGSVDKNVFDIQQGVCITFFVKTSAMKNGLIDNNNAIKQTMDNMLEVAIAHQTQEIKKGGGALPSLSYGYLW